MWLTADREPYSWQHVCEEKQKAVYSQKRWKTVTAVISSALPTR